MKPISSILAKGALLCLSLVPAALAGPGGTYTPTPPRGYGPAGNGSNDGGGFGGGFSHRGHDHYQPRTIIGPTRTVVPSKPGGPDSDDFRDGRNRPYFDRDHDDFDRDRNRDRDFDRDRRPAGVVPPPRRPGDRYPIHVHRPSYYKGGWYHGDWHDNWAKTLKTRPYAWNGWGGSSGWNGKVTATVAGSPWRFGYWSYSNPYYVANPNGPTYFNYSQPIIASNITVDATGQFYPQVIGQGSRDQALQLFGTARAAFFNGDIRTAQNQIDQAIAILPSDTVLHEFRALVLFARRDYGSAAGAIYAVLSTGPGWDWTTLIGLYPNASIYTAQLRTLEDFCNANPRVANARFVLAYHYLTAGYVDAAAEMYRQVVKINPRDSLSAQLLASLTGTGLNPIAQLNPIGSVNINNQFLVGNWAATRDDGSSFQLALRNDGFYNWVYTQNGRRQQLTGNYLISDGLLILNQDGQPALMGQIIPMSGNRFVFKLQGSDPYDPGLTFYK